jgi:hypothetical protein
VVYAPCNHGWLSSPLGICVGSLSGWVSGHMEGCLWFIRSPVRDSPIATGVMVGFLVWLGDWSHGGLSVVFNPLQ